MDRGRRDGRVATRGGRAFRREREVGGQVASVLAPNRKRCAETPRRERFSIGEVRGAGTGCDSRASRPDVDGDGREARPAAYSHQQECAFAVLRSPQYHPQKKACKLPNGSERMWHERADVGYESKACLIPPGWYLSTRRRSAPICHG